MRTDTGPFEAYDQGRELPLPQRSNGGAQVSFMKEFQSDYLGAFRPAFKVNYPGTACGSIGIQHPKRCGSVMALISEQDKCALQAGRSPPNPNCCTGPECNPLGFAFFPFGQLA